MREIKIGSMCYGPLSESVNDESEGLLHERYTEKLADEIIRRWKRVTREFPAQPWEKATFILTEEVYRCRFRGKPVPEGNYYGKVIVTLCIEDEPLILEGGK